MNFETKTIETRNWRRTWYGVISIILFAIANIVIFVLGPKEGMLDKDYLTEWFGTYKKPFLWLNLLLYANGVVFMFIEKRRSYKTIGNVRMTDEAIEITEPNATIAFPTSDIDTIRLKYNGYKTFWRKEGAGNRRGNMNYITIADSEKKEYGFEFYLSSYLDKKNMVAQLLSFQKKGIKIKLDYLYHFEVYPNDIDFLELKLQERWLRK